MNARSVSTKNEFLIIHRFCPPVEKNGMISGTPTATGTYTFNVKATDAFGCMGMKSYTITIAAN